MDTNTDSIATRIKYARHMRGLSQQKLGEQLGVKQSNVGRWETGEHIPRSSTIIRIAEALKVNPNWLLSGEGSPVWKHPPLDREYVKFYPPPIRYLPVRGKCPGKYPLLDVADVEEMDAIPSDMTEHPDAFVLHMIDNHMYPPISKGDKVIIEPMEEEPGENDTYLWVEDDKTFICTYHIGPDGAPWLIATLLDTIVLVGERKEKIKPLGKVMGLHKYIPMPQ